MIRREVRMKSRYQGEYFHVYLGEKVMDWFVWDSGEWPGFHVNYPGMGSRRSRFPNKEKAAIFVANICREYG